MKIMEIKPKAVLLVAFFLLLTSYSLFQARFVILGPYIEIQTPKNGASLDTNLINIIGRAENISFISLNDRPIFVDKNGNWNEKLIAPQGLSIITVRAKDRFGRSTEKQVEIFVK